jgi:PAS domain-containing protein
VTYTWTGGGRTVTEGHDAWVSIIYDRLNDAVFLLGVEGSQSELGFRFETVNRSFLTLTGLAPEQVIGSASKRSCRRARALS